MKEVCWICGRKVNRTYLSQFDPEHKYPLCWFCVHDIYGYVCNGEHGKCLFWEGYCTRKINYDEMNRVKALMQKDGVGGFRFVRK